ncbi:carboxypeptidase-like regulatory domain-containing protein [Flavobacterium sp.]|uniref:carboxypeptidase-like regulatory domain-containing protein n=1 Tax=Flavobacterium sp. TaxID=239 RepID=UPI002602A552|nr:carboxypeptidase-like regulatory domain-containing protein [Flavobacterium sp.]
MRNKTPIVLFLLLCSAFNYAQTTFSGTVKDKTSGEALAYVNIGIVNKNVGTVTDANGKFTLAIDSSFDGETIRISMVGYKALVFPAADFKKKITTDPLLFLERSTSNLKEVVIKKKKMTTGILGNVPARKTESAGFVNNVLGNEIGVPIKLKKKPTYLKSFHAMIDFNRYRELKFRLNFYDLKDGLPNNSLLSENIIVTSTLKKGQLDVDLTPYNIWAEGDFFVSIELIEGLGEGGLHFIADYKGTPVITRAASQGKWNADPADGLSFAFWVTAAY